MPSLELEDSFGFLLNRLARAVESAFDSALSRHGLTATGWGILKVLEGRDSATLSELTQSLGIDASNTGRQVDRLAAEGLVRVRRDPNDARARRAELTGEGHGLIPELERLARKHNAMWLERVPEENRAILLASLASMLEGAGVLQHKETRE